MNKVATTAETKESLTEDMPISPGYKRTEVGVIPKDWEVKPLSTRSEKVMVGIASAATHAYRATGVPLLRNQNIKAGYLQDDDILYVDPEYELKFSNKRLRIGDLLTARTGYPGMSCVVPPRYESAQSFTTLITRPKKKDIDSSYLCQYINSDRGQAFFDRNMIGGAQKNVNAGTLRQMPIPAPLLDEQQAIAEVLSDADELISALDNLIAKNRALKLATMQRLLNGKTRLPGFKAAWRETTLGEVIVGCSSGSTPSRNRPEFYKGDIRWITSGELNYGVIVDTQEKITAEAVKKTNLKMIPAGTFLMAITGLEAEGTRGSCGIVGADSTTNQSCMAIFPSEELISEYLFYYYVYRGKTLALQYCQGTKQQSYTAKTVKNLPICFPTDVNEQGAIVTVLSDIDVEINALVCRRDKNKDIKQGMAQALLNGRIRLVTPEVVPA